LELVVDDQHLGPLVAVCSLQLLELPLADVAARIGPRPPLDHLRDRNDARRARELPELRELLVGVDALRQHGEEQSTLGLRPVPELGFACRHRGSMPRAVAIVSPP
jgi:hypothetical protein